MYVPIAIGTVRGLGVKLPFPYSIYHDMTNPVHLSGPHRLDNFIMTPSSRPSIRTLQKLMPTLTLRCAQARLRRQLIKPPGR